MYAYLTTHFLLSLSLGTCLFSWIADPRLTGAGFMRLILGHGLVFFILCIGLLFVLHDHSLIVPPWYQVVMVLTLLIQWRYHPEKRNLSMWLLFGVQSILLFYQVSKMGSALASQIFLLSSVMFLGITQYAMLLGHYYLVVPKLTEKPLLVCLKIFWIIMLAKVIASSVATYQAGDYLNPGNTLGDGYLFNSLVVVMRWLWGYVALVVLSVFAWRLCRMRSIQSATGVLYIMVFFVFVGELLSAYLFFKHGLRI